MPRAAQEGVPDLRLRPLGVPVDEHADAMSERARNGNLPRAEQGHVLPVGKSARRDGRGAAMDLVRDEMAQAGRAMDPAAMALLVDRAGGDVTKLRPSESLALRSNAVRL